jgi:hypothetical protein
MPIRSRRAALFAATGLSFLGSLPVRAQESESRLNGIEHQIQALQAELSRVKHDLAARNKDIATAKMQAERASAAAELAHAAQTSPPSVTQIPAGYALVQGTSGGAPVLERVEVAPPEGPALPPGTFRVGQVTVTLGGFIEAAGIYRSRNEIADIASNYNTGIPLRNSVNYHQPEVRGSARQSRFSALVQAKPDPVTTLNAFVEFDLLGAAPTANSVESNSYNPRIRHAYLTYDRSDWGLQILAGQTWTLLTMDKVGITARQENIPYQIDAQYIPGFTWARDPQLRVVKSFDDKQFWLAASIESPQTSYYTGPNGLAPSSLGSINITNAGGSNYYSGNNYSDDISPDVQVKAAADFWFGHLEAYGVGRVLHDRVSAVGQGVSNTAFAGGGGAAALIHVIPKYLDAQVSFLAGQGIGRYGSAQLPDAVVGKDGAPVALPEVEALAGIVGHPTRDIDVYTYLGTEQIGRKYFSENGKGYGYGSPLYSNTSCDVELGSSADCIGNTSAVTQGTLGAWWKFVHNQYGTMQVGAQYSYTERQIFQGLGPTPHTNENIVLFSFRYYPFQ